MRSILITAGVLVALISIFVVFLVVQKPSMPQVKRTTPRGGTTLPTIKEGGSSSLGGGNGAWFQRFDPKTGDRISEIRAKTYDPPIDNVVHVTDPEARFYAKDGQILTLAAKTGDITLTQAARKSEGLDSLQSQPPSRGKLYDVTLELQEADDDEPVLTATLPVIEFDNDTLRLNTPAMMQNGETVAADRVPVVVRGRDYDFDGEGLIVRYNQRDNRLERLEVAHGKRLVVKHPDSLGKNGGLAHAGPLMENGRPVEFVAADPEPARRMSAEERERRLQRRAAASRRANRGTATRPATRVASTRPREIFSYVATFHDDVKLTEGGELVGTADTMAVTFASKSDADAAASQPGVVTTQPNELATQPARQPRPVGATQRAVVQPATSMPTVANAPPSTAPSGPVEITWTGKLVVIPKKLAESGLRSTRDRIIEFAGRPTTLMRQGSKITAATIRAATEGDRLRAAPDTATTVVTITDPTGTTLVTESIEADGDNANLHGKSRAEIVLNKDETLTGNPTPATQPTKLVTTWDKFATLRLTTRAGNKRGIERAIFNGNVHVDHPQLDMTSDTLALGFTQPPAAKQPQISAVRADGAVKATIKSNDGTPQSINAETLDLATAADADNKLAVRSMHAHGNVVASDPKQVLKADDLTVTPSPTTDAKGGPVTLAVDQMTAAGHVHFATADGATAESDRLSVDRVDGGQWITLVGTPAKVTDPRMSVSGNYLRVNAENGGHAIIDGPGTLHAVQAGENGKAGQPIDVAWVKSMDYDAAANKAGVVGHVNIVTRAADGTISTAKGETLDLVLADAPATGAAKKPAEKQAGMSLGGGNNGAGKVVKSFTLRGPAGRNIEVSSELRDPNDVNKLIRLAYLEAAMATVDMNPDGTLGAMNVPVAGRLLYDNNGQAAATTTNPTGGNGTIALEWNKSMTYEPAKQQAVLDGGVHVVRQAEGQPAMTLSAPRVVADVTGNAAPGGAQLKRVTAENATLSTPQATINAATAAYDPVASLVIAKGTPREPVKWFDEKGLSKGSFGEVWWDLKKNEPAKLIDVTGELNR